MYYIELQHQQRCENLQTTSSLVLLKSLLARDTTTLELKLYLVLEVFPLGGEDLESIS
jgi:hypothetical protein